MRELHEGVRDTYIRQVVAGKSFADVGGLWGTVNEKVSVAHAHGARTLSMIDVSPPDSELWVLFEERRRTLRLPTAEALRAMCEVAGFRYEVGAPSWNGNAHTLRLSVRS